MIKNKILFHFIWVLFCVINLSAQTDWVRWEGVNNYLLEDSDYDNNWNEHFDGFNDKRISNIPDFLVKFYKITISDFDGNNCRFHPSCSEFFVESTKINNSLISVLLFFDRLTRDTNIFSSGGYRTMNNRYYDPPSDYIFYQKESNQ